jgi:hypothetical protein
LDAAVGFALTHNDAQPLDAPAPLELLFAPALNRYRGRIGVLYDYSVNERFRLRGYADGYLLGREAEFRAPTGFDNITTRVGVGADIGFCRRYECRFTFGAAWWNSDQRAIDTETFESVRSNDIWPTLDFIWQG